MLRGAGRAPASQHQSTTGDGSSLQRHVELGPQRFDASMGQDGSTEKHGREGEDEGRSSSGELGGSGDLYETG